MCIDFSEKYIHFISYKYTQTPPKTDEICCFSSSGRRRGLWITALAVACHGRTVCAAAGGHIKWMPSAAISPQK